MGQGAHWRTAWTAPTAAWTAPTAVGLRQTVARPNLVVLSLGSFRILSCQIVIR